MAAVALLSATACSQQPTPRSEGRPDTGAARAAAACDPRRGEICVDLIGTYNDFAARFEATFYERENAPGARPGVRAALVRYGAGRPVPGRYPLGVFKPECGTSGGWTTKCGSHGGPFYFTYHSPTSSAGDTTRVFVSVGGEVVVEESAPDSTRGSFSFTAAEYHASWRAGQSGSGSPSSVPANAARLRVRGTFVVFRPVAAPRIVLACGGPPGPAVLVEVRDRADRPAADGTILVIEDGEFKDSVDWAQSPEFIGAGGRRPGRYQVRLYKPGYRSVVLDDVVAPSSGPPCNVITGTVTRRVTLQPLRARPSGRNQGA
jgi:hypothetical protein